MQNALQISKKVSNGSGIMDSHNSARFRPRFLNIITDFVRRVRTAFRRPGKMKSAAAQNGSGRDGSWESLWYGIL